MNFNSTSFQNLTSEYGSYLEPAAKIVAGITGQVILHQLATGLFKQMHFKAQGSQFAATLLTGAVAVAFTLYVGMSPLQALAIFAIGTVLSVLLDKNKTPTSKPLSTMEEGEKKETIINMVINHLKRYVEGTKHTASAKLDAPLLEKLEEGTGCTLTEKEITIAQKQYVKEATKIIFKGTESYQVYREKNRPLYHEKAVAYMKENIDQYAPIEEQNKIMNQYIDEQIKKSLVAIQKECLFTRLQPALAKDFKAPVSDDQIKKLISDAFKEALEELGTSETEILKLEKAEDLHAIFCVKEPTKE